MFVKIFIYAYIRHSRMIEDGKNRGDSGIIILKHLANRHCKRSFDFVEDYRSEGRV